MTKLGRADKWAARSERLSAALRENLKRRKAQAKNRIKERVKEGAGKRELTGDSAAAENAAPRPEIESVRPDFRRNRGQD